MTLGLKTSILHYQTIREIQKKNSRKTFPIDRVGKLINLLCNLQCIEDLPQNYSPSNSINQVASRIEMLQELSLKQ